MSPRNWRHPLHVPRHHGTPRFDTVLPRNSSASGLCPGFSAVIWAVEEKRGDDVNYRLTYLAFSKVLFL